MTVFLLSFNISACIYVRRLITAFHRDESCLPKWAKTARAVIDRLEPPEKKFFLDDVYTDTNKESEQEKWFFTSELFTQENPLRLEQTANGFDMRDELEIKRQKKIIAEMDSINEQKDDELSESMDKLTESILIEENQDDYGDGDLEAAISTAAKDFEKMRQTIEENFQSGEPSY